MKKLQASSYKLQAGHLQASKAFDLKMATCSLQLAACSSI